MAEELEFYKCYYKEQEASHERGRNIKEKMKREDKEKRKAQEGEERR